MPDANVEQVVRSTGDQVHALVKAALSVVPVVGGPAVELFQYVVQPPLEKRRDEWMRSIGEKLEELRANGLDISTLQTNEQFISAVMQASQAALRTHSALKLAALRNAITNIASGKSPEETIQEILLSLVDQLSEMHLRVLKVFHNPEPPRGMSVGGLVDVLHQSIPSLRGQRELGDKIWTDLHTNGLVNTQNLHGTMSGNGLAERRTTDLGAALLNFISEQA